MWVVVGFILLISITSLFLDATMKKEDYAEERCRYNYWS